jgi:cytochrome c-type biogenesis protein CcmH
MLLWISFGVLVAVALAFVLRPLLSNDAGAASGPEGDATAIYRDQLSEIDAERDRGLLASSEAAAAKVEISRRLLASDDARVAVAAGAPGLGLSARARARLGLMLAAVVPLTVLGVYLLLGSPGIPAAPESARVQLRHELAAVEARLKANPKDGEGWDVVAPAYLQLERFSEAEAAYGRALLLLGDTPQRLAGFIDASRLAHDGALNEVARAALQRLVQLEPSRPDLRIILATARQQAGDLTGAEADYETLLKLARPDEAWRPLVERRLEEVRALRQGEAMVQRLADRLKAEGGDLAGWQRLIRAYTVLGRRPQATAALGEARRLFGNEPASLAILADLARSLGLES